MTTPSVEIGDDHDVWRGGSLWRREKCASECERKVKRCVQAFRAPASSEGLLLEVERSVAGVAVPVRVARLARPLGGLARATGRSTCLILSEAGRRVDGGRSRGSWGYACAARWRRACRLGGGGEDGGVIGRKRERGCAEGASRLALRCADADDARMTWMIRSTSPRLSRSLNAPLAGRYRSSALGARHSALQTGYEHQASETAAHGDSLAGLLDGAISDQARASMGLCASDARGIRAGGGNVAAVLE
ncbi:hypothetical protein B0H13DRAFT_1888334 [Mycena leptocephala]|nr:hypothetical protein B0H13DRAFT_1888334 [Mycena leptocephala]